MTKAIEKMDRRPQLDLFGELSAKPLQKRRASPESRTFGPVSWLYSAFGVPHDRYRYNAIQATGHTHTSQLGCGCPADRRTSGRWFLLLALHSQTRIEQHSRHRMGDLGSGIQDFSVDLMVRGPDFLATVMVVHRLGVPAWSQPI